MPLGHSKRQDPRVGLRQLVQLVDWRTCNQLFYRGWQYRMVVSEDISLIPDREQYDVVGYAEAQRILSAIVRMVRPELGVLLCSASDGLIRTQDAKRRGLGLLLLRRIIRPRDVCVLPKNHLAPSQMRALMRRTRPKTRR